MAGESPKLLTRKVYRYKYVQVKFTPETDLLCPEHLPAGPLQ